MRQIAKKLEPTFVEGLVYHVPAQLAPSLGIENAGANATLCSILDTCTYLAKGVRELNYVFHLLHASLNDLDAL